MVNAAVLIGGGHAAVVGGEDDDGVFSEPKFLELGSNAAKALIGGLQHAGKFNVVLYLFHPPHALVLMQLQSIVLFECLELGGGQRRPIRIGFQNIFRPLGLWHRGKFLAIFFHQILAALDGIVHGKVLEVHKEGPILVALNKIHRGIGEFVCVIIALLGRQRLGVLR